MLICCNGTVYDLDVEYYIEGNKTVVQAVLVDKRSGDADSRVLRSTTIWDWRMRLSKYKSQTLEDRINWFGYAIRDHIRVTDSFKDYDPKKVYGDF